MSSKRILRPRAAMKTGRRGGQHGFFEAAQSAKTPGADCGGLRGRVGAVVFATHPDAERSRRVALSGRNCVRRGARLLRDATRCDVAYILPRSFRAALESRLARIPERIGYAGDLRGLLLTTTAIPLRRQISLRSSIFETHRRRIVSVGTESGRIFPVRKKPAAEKIGRSLFGNQSEASRPRHRADFHRAVAHMGAGTFRANGQRRRFEKKRRHDRVVRRSPSKEKERVAAIASRRSNFGRRGDQHGRTNCRCRNSAGR